MDRVWGNNYRATQAKQTWATVALCFSAIFLIASFSNNDDEPVNAAAPIGA